MVKKLTLEKKSEMVLSHELTYRELGTKYGVHHSVIAEIFKESEEVLSNYWSTKSQRIGRPRKEKKLSSELDKSSEKEKKKLAEELALKAMRIDWLELQLKFLKDRGLESNRVERKQLKKKRKNQ